MNTLRSGGSLFCLMMWGEVDSSQCKEKAFDKILILFIMKLFSTLPKYCNGTLPLIKLKEDIFHKQFIKLIITGKRYFKK